MKEQTPLQKILVVLAWISYTLAIACGVAAALKWEGASWDPMVASLMASVVFFLGAGIVVHVIGRTRLPDLKVDR